ncbi:hypothetical protein OB03_06790 [Brevundimonas sp. GN22]
MASYSLVGKKVWVAGHRGMVGSAIVRRLENEQCHVVFATSQEVDLRNPDHVQRFLDTEKPHAAFIAAAKVGGIQANNTFPVEFLRDNILISTNVISACAASGVEKLLFLGSSCIYPKHAEQPIKEDSLLTGPLEPTNEAYAIAKIAGVKLAEYYNQQYGLPYISGMPTNLYGPGDNYDLDNSHVLPAIIRKAHEARINNAPFIEVWGTGVPRREFMHADDCADASVFLMQNYSEAGLVNIGYGEDISIRNLAETVAEVVGYKGELKFDSSKPDGTPRKLMDSSRIRTLGWSPRIPFVDGIKSTYAQFLKEYGQ